MIEAVKIEDFVIEQLFRPYTFMLIPYDVCEEDKSERKRVEKKLKQNPENIIGILDGNQEAKQLVFNRLKRCGGVKWYRYLDMSNPVIRWVNENLEDQ